MGRNNRQRRAARKRRQARKRSGRAGAQRPRAGSGRARAGSARTRAGDGPDTASLLHAAIHAWQTDAESYELLVDRLGRRATADATVHTIARQHLDDRLDTLWRDGWTPSDVVGATTRRLTSAHGDIVRDAAVADGQRRTASGAPPHSRWQAQLDLLQDTLRLDLEGPHAPDLPRLVAVLALLARLPAIPPVMPGPGQTAASDLLATTGMDQRLLARVRRLLAKAESTDFDEEAEALTAKAQELITRHAIADALLETPHHTGDPSARRVPVDNPYPDAKASLLAAVARANRCRAVHSDDLGWVTLFGYDGDLDAVEVLGASLLAQATNAMARQGSRRGSDGRSTTRSFRRAFLFGFAARIGERLRAAADGEIEATGTAQSRLLPVLAARDDLVEAALAAAFPHAERRSTQISNSTGWSAGRAAADLADIGAHERRLST